MKKKLAIILEEKREKEIEKLLKDDYIIITCLKRFKSFKKEKVVYIDLLDYKNMEDVNMMSQRFMDEIKDKVHFFDIAYKSFINHICVNFFRPLMNLTVEIDKILKKERIEEIVLYGGNPQVEYFSITFSLGETFSNFLHSNEIFNYYINKIYSSKNKIIFKKKESKIKIYFIKFIKRELVRLFLNILDIIRIVCTKKKKIEKLNLKNKILFSVKTRTHKQLMKKLKEYDEHNKIEILEHYNLRNLKEDSQNSIYSYITLTMFLSKKKKSLYFKSKLDNKIEVMNLVKLSEIKEELSINENYIILRELFFNKIRFIYKYINLEIRNFKAGIDYYLLKEKVMKNITLQTVALTEIRLPNYCFADEVLTLREEIASKLNKLNNVQYFRYHGNIFNFNYNKYRKNLNKKIVIFTQPNFMVDKYKELLKELLKLDRKGYEFYIKLHPRNKRNDFKEFREIKIISGKDNYLVMDKFEKVVSISSSILEEATNYGIPTYAITYLSDTRFLYFNDCIEIFSKDELVKIFENDTNPKKYKIKDELNIYEYILQSD